MKIIKASEGIRFVYIVNEDNNEKKITRKLNRIRFLFYIYIKCGTLLKFRNTKKKDQT